MTYGAGMPDLNPPFHPVRARRAIAVSVAVAVVGVTACTGSRPPLPELAGPLADVVVHAALAVPDADPAPAVQPLLLDSVSFARLGVAAGGSPLGHAELEGQVSRPVTLTDGRSVLTCPDREPCRLAEGGAYLEVWEATMSGAEMDIVVTQVRNVQDLYVMTSSVTYRLVVRQEGGRWRLVRRDRLPD